MSAALTAGALAPFQVRSFRFQWPADLSVSWAFEMEALILGWYVLVTTGSVKMLVLYGAVQWAGSLFSPMFGVAGDRFGHRRILCVTRATYAVLAASLTTLALSGLLVPWHVFVIAALVGLIRPSDMVMRQALIAQIMPSQQLLGALAISRTTADSARIAGFARRSRQRGAVRHGAGLPGGHPAVFGELPAVAQDRRAAHPRAPCACDAPARPEGGVRLCLDQARPDGRGFAGLSGEPAGLPLFPGAAAVYRQGGLWRGSGRFRLPGGGVFHRRPDRLHPDFHAPPPAARGTHHADRSDDLVRRRAGHRQQHQLRARPGADGHRRPVAQLLPDAAGGGDVARRRRPHARPRDGHAHARGLGPAHGPVDRRTGNRRPRLCRHHDALWRYWAWAWCWTIGFAWHKALWNPGAPANARG